MLAKAGRNCWRVERADRFLSIQDASDYFRLVRRALLAARKTVFILGWDILASVDLEPGETSGGAPTRLGPLLEFIGRRNPRLRCDILIWDYGSLYTLERDPFSRWKLGWRTPKNVRFGFDDRHPVGGSHHQKIVVVDDQLAFCGGIDLTGHRWDTSAHRLEEPHRKSFGSLYGPYHEMQAMLSGPAAASLGALARERWRAIGDTDVPAPSESREDLWPADVTPDFTNASVAIARTMPGSEAQPATRECEALFEDSIAAAKNLIYIESQYVTNRPLAEAVAARLSSPAPPEVIIVAPRKCEGWLERNTMGARRGEVFRLLIAADTHKKLRILCPMASRASDVPTFVHSKLTVIDDTLFRIGSANFSRRSMGMDTECDVAVDATDDGDARQRVTGVFHRLLGEHLGLRAEDVTRGIEAAGSIAAFIDSRADADRTLTRIALDAEDAGLPAVVQEVADPDEPVQFGPPVAELLPRADAGSGASALRSWILPSIMLVAAAATVFIDRHDAAELRGVLDIARHGTFWEIAAIAVFAIASILLAPVELMAIAAGVLFGTRDGVLVALTGSLAAAAAGYAAGRTIGAVHLGRRISRRAYRSVRQLGARGVAGVIVLRLTSVAGARAIDLLCGAGRVPLLSFAAGSIVGLAPSMIALAALGGLLRRALLHASIQSGMAVIGAAALIVLAGAVLRTVLLARQFASSLRTHRAGAEFG
jgi:phosphatidylserine/phosphatidylglycerophosphate/cardiolipin synthase-like enzyme/uncharacterized membrane protein YdjX (TVP38/TMEM64 family)